MKRKDKKALNNMMVGLIKESLVNGQIPEIPTLTSEEKNYCENYIFAYWAIMTSMFNHGGIPLEKFAKIQKSYNLIRSSIENTKATIKFPSL